MEDSPIALVRYGGRSIVLPNTGTRLVPEYFCLIPEQIASKRNKLCITLSCLIPDYLPHSRIFLPYSGTDFLKIRPIARQYSLVKAY